MSDEEKKEQEAADKTEEETTEKAESEDSESEEKKASSDKDVPEGESKKEAPKEVAPREKKAVVSADTVVVGMTGRMDSTVAAFLLKKQGFKVIGLSLQLFDPHESYYRADRLIEGHGYDTDEIDQSLAFLQEITPHCHLGNLEDIKAICDVLEIPFYGVSALDVFKERVFNQAVGSRLAGKDYFPCADCNRVVITTLMEKANILGAKYVATGHYAKLQYSQKQNLYSLSCSPDTENDQSFALAKLPQEKLARMILPLADMRKAEVEKIAKSMSWPLVKKGPKKKACFVGNPKFYNLMERVSPPDLRKSGQVLRYEDETFIDDHKGVHRYFIGQKGIVTDTKDESKASAVTSLVVVDIKPSIGQILMAPSDKLSFNKIYASNFRNRYKIDISKPLDVYLQFGMDHEKVKARMIIKNNGHLLFELAQERRGIMTPGTFVSIFSKQGAGGKLMGKAEVVFKEDLSGIAKLREDDDNDGDKKNAKEEENPFVF